jgi:hypothetical protein
MILILYTWSPKDSRSLFPSSRKTFETALDVAATAVAVARVRGARAARVVTVTGAVDFALNDHAVTAVAVVTGDEERQKAGDEEEDAVPG